MIVIFNCPPQSGKDSVADYLITNYSEKFVKLSFKSQLLKKAEEYSGVTL